MIALRLTYRAAAKAISSIAVQAGDLVVVGLYQDGASVATSCADSGGNIYLKAAEQHITDGAGCGIYLYYTVAEAAGNLTITGTMAGSGYNTIFVHVYSGNFSLATVLHSYQTKGETSRSTNHTSGSVTTTTSATLLLCFFGESSGAVTLSENGSGFTEREEDSGTATYDRIVSATGTYADSVTSTLATALASVLVAFQEATPGGINKPLVRASSGGLAEVQLSSADLSDGPFPNVANVREVLSAARTYYVRTDGNDLNTGLANTAGGAFLTIQKAVDSVAVLDVGIHQVTIRVADGTYNGTTLLRSYIGAVPPKIIGNETTAANVLCTSNTGDVFWSSPTSSQTPSVWIIIGVKMTTTTGGASCVHAEGHNTIKCSNVEFGACVANHIYAANYGSVIMDGNYKISGAAPRHVYGTQYGFLQILVGVVVTITGTPAFSTCFAMVTKLSIFQTPVVTFSGSATGTRYVSDSLSVISTNAGGATYLPGNSAGAVSNGGIYT